MENEICGAPGCGKPSSKASGKRAWSINGIQLCHGCYHRIWKMAKSQNSTKEEVFAVGIAKPKRLAPYTDTICARQGCATHLPADGKANVRRMIGPCHVCRNCYEAAWKIKPLGKSVEYAFLMLKPKRGR